MTFLAHNSVGKKERSLPRTVHVRRGSQDDEYATFEVMRRAMGYDMNWSQHMATRHHLRQSANASFWVAEETPRFGSARIVGYARSIVRDSVWCLTEFFVLPSHHRQGIGGALLDHCLADSVDAGADTRLVLASQHPSANSLYMRKAGCYPRVPMLLLAGSLANLVHAERENADMRSAAHSAGAADIAPGTLIAEPMAADASLQPALDALDREIIGYARPQEHAHWVSQTGGLTGSSCLFRRIPSEGVRCAMEAPIVGYAYLGLTSSGPALAKNPEDLPAMIASVAARQQSELRLAPEPSLMRAAEQYWAIAGTNEVMLRWLLDCGWQIVFQYLFMSSRPVGMLDRYICHNPLYVL